MPRELPKEIDLVRYAREQEVRKMTTSELLERYKVLTLELVRIPLEHSRLTELAKALEAEIQPYIDQMDALEGAQQQAYIDSTPEHVRQSIDLLNATEAALTKLEEFSEELSVMQRLTDELYEAQSIKLQQGSHPSIQA